MLKTKKQIIVAFFFLFVCFQHSLQLLREDYKEHYERAKTGLTFEPGTIQV
jgi:hypothetical protein